ncbi:MAG: hypothetical protein CO108_11780 [Deltaproteobacteria bacterium CG_4_9_14_3_um_filter_63_12]|nr:MAG: hypothetical protein CO108_11780 [Deltaproteobacteria bacterium CG_4_9_14_3_um_filter_63_12]
MNTLRVLAAFVALLALGAPASAADLEPEIEKQALRLVELLEGMASIVKTAGTDCDKMGVDLGSWVEVNGEEIRALSRRMSTLSEEQNSALELKFKARVEVALEGFMAAGQCAANPKVSAALQAIGPESGGATEPQPLDETPLSDEIKAKAERVVVLMESLGQTITAAKGDCDVLGDTLSTFLDKKGQELDALIAEMEALSPQASEALDREFNDRIMQAVSKFEGLGKCIDNPKVEAAMKKLPM